MIDIKAISLDKANLFKEPTCYEIKDGLNIIVGKNTNRANGATNYSGKTLLLSPISSVLLDTSPVPGTSGRARTKDLFGPKTLAAVNLCKNKNLYEVKRVGSKKSVIKNGKDLGLRSQAIPEYIKKLVPCTEDELATLHLLSGNRPSPFQYGSSATRFQFFSSIFGLDRIDLVRQKANKELSELEDAKAQIKEMRAERRALVLPESVPDIKNIKKILRDIQIKKSELELNWNLYDSSKKAFDKAKSLYDKFPEFKDHVVLRGFDPNAFKFLMKQIECKKRVHEIEKKISSINISDKPGISLEEAESLIDKWRSVPKAPKWTNKIPKPTISKEELEKLSTRTGKIKLALHRSKQTLSKIEHALEDHDSNSCPTCDQTLTARQAGRLIYLARKEVKSLSRKYNALNTTLQKAAEDHEDFKEYKASITWAKAAAVLKTANSALDIYRERNSSIKERESLRLSLKETLNSKYYVNKNLERLNKELERQEDKTDAYHVLVNIPKRTKAPVLRRNAFDVKERKYARLYENAIKLGEKYRETKEQRIKITRKINSTKFEEVRYKTLKLLASALDTKNPNNIRQRACATLGAALEERMNTWSHSVFGDNRKFRIEVTHNTFSILYTLDTGPEDSRKWTDIRNMCGAESRLWTILNAKVLSPMLPSERQWQQLILDEADSALDEVSLRALTHVLIPELCKLFRSIIVITPNSPSDFIEGAHSHGIKVQLTTVIRKGNISTLETKNVSQ